MAAGLSRPDVWAGVAWNRDPNDPTMPAVWTPLDGAGAQLLKVGENQRGRDFELAQPMASDPTLLLRDINEWLNPDNTSAPSPYNGNVVPFRECCMLAQWPITPVGGAVNLINSGTWRGAMVDPYDPSFESYTTGASAPNWLTRIGGTVATISTTTPQQGSKDVSYTVAGTTTPQGLDFGVPVIPGRQYTTSVYVRQSSASTQQIAVEGVTAVYDPFDRTSVAGMGTPVAGAAYATSGGTSADYNVTPGSAVLTVSAANSIRSAVTGSFHDSDQTVLITAPVLATGAQYYEGLTSRWVDGNNHYRAFIRFNTDGSIALFIERRLASVSTSLNTTNLPLHYAAGDQFYLRFVTYGSVLVAYCWPADRAASAIYTTGEIVDTSAALAGSGAIGLMTYRDTANTNTNLPAEFNRYGATGSVLGDSTTTTGAYVRLDVTYVADKPGRPAGATSADGQIPAGLAVSVRTLGTAVAGTVLMDAIQHEQGSSPSTWTASGPAIYPVLRDMLEQLPRQWSSRGYEGFTDATASDALGALNRIRIGTEVRQSILATQPRVYWSLSDGTQTGSFFDQSGNGGPPLTRYVSKYGAGTDIVPGTAIPLAGSPNGTGVQFTHTGNTSTVTGTALGTTALVGPDFASSDGSWQMSFACWASANELAGTVLQALLAWSRDGAVASPFAIRGLWFEIDDTGAPGTAGLVLSVSGPAGAVSLTAGPLPTVFDGNPHHYAFSIAVTGTGAGNAALSIWVDGVQTSGALNLGAWGAGNTPMRYLTVGLDTAGLTAYEWDGVISDVAIWDRAITDAEVQNMFTSGLFGYNGELTGARITRHLTLGGYTGPVRIASGSTGLGPPTFDGSVDLLTDSLNSMQAEQGVLWVQPDGVLAFEGRQQRWLRLTSSYTFGENEAGGEVPYALGIVFNPDPSYVFPIVTWTRTNGAIAVGGSPRERLEASRRSFPRQFDGQSDLYADEDAQYLADWIFHSHRAALTRVQEMTINPWADPALWPIALSLEPGQRVTVVRRAKAANAGAGFTIQGDFFVERVGEPEINFMQDQETWTVAVQLSPIGAGNAPDGPTMQPWILGDTTYGVLDQTTVLGF